MFCSVGYRAKAIKSIAEKIVSGELTIDELNRVNMMMPEHYLQVFTELETKLPTVYCCFL
jgi:3-methyladenine DNA glycosylase/8-oxoguanine DNA glycosylase